MKVLAQQPYGLGETGLTQLLAWGTNNVLVPQLHRSFQKAQYFTASIVVCSGHVLGSPLISIVVTRIQDLASEFSKTLMWVLCTGN